MGLPLGAMEQMFAAIQQGAAETGRDPGSLKLTVIAHPELHSAPLGDERSIFAGSAEQIEEDIFATRRLGTDELIFNALFSPDICSTEDLLACMEQLQMMARRSEREFSREASRSAIY
jgi:hypothetical protein